MYLYLPVGQVSMFGENSLVGHIRTSISLSIPGLEFPQGWYLRLQPYSFIRDSHVKVFAYELETCFFGTYLGKDTLIARKT